LVNGYQESGVRQAIWSGKDGNGNAMPSGIYFYRLVSLKVFDLMGKEVATLVNGYQESGVRQAIWSGKDGNGNAMPSGIYFYRLEVNGLVLTKKMQLLK